MENDKGFKIRIAGNKKGGLRLPIKEGFMEANHVFDLSPVEFFHPSVQLAIQNNLIVVEKRMTDEEAKGKVYISACVKTLNIPQLGGIIRYKQQFFVPNERTNDAAIAMIIRDKWILPVEETQTVETAAPVVQTVPAAPVVPASQNTEVKETLKNERRYTRPKTKQSEESKGQPKPVRGAENIPANMHVHVPHAVRDDVSIRKIPKSGMILDVTKDTAAEEIDFVDKDQESAKLRDHNVENNEEVQ